MEMMCTLNVKCNGWVWVYKQYCVLCTYCQHACKLTWDKLERLIRLSNRKGSVHIFQSGYSATIWQILTRCAFRFKISKLCTVSSVIIFRGDPWMYMKYNPLCSFFDAKYVSVLWRPFLCVCNMGMMRWWWHWHSSTRVQKIKKRMSGNR